MTKKKNPYRSLSTEPIKAPNKSREEPKVKRTEGDDLRVKGGSNGRRNA